MTLPRQAVAIEYGHNITPIVSAKAEGDLALDMIAEARRHGVLITEDPELLAQLTQLQVDHYWHCGLPNRQGPRLVAGCELES